MNCATETRTALYRFYDARERLLYVGITDDPWRRWRQHVLAKPWYPQVRHQSVTWYDARDQAEAAEKRAIKAEQPRFNIAGAVRPPEARFAVNGQLVEYICTFWIMAQPVTFLAGLFVRPLAPLAIAVFLSCVVPILAWGLVFSAPQIYVFGCWLVQNFGDYTDKRVAGFASIEARR